MKTSDEQIAETITRIDAKQETVTAAARRLGLSRSTLRGRIETFKRKATERSEPGVVEHEDGAISVISDLVVGGVPLTPEAMLLKFGMDPEDFEIVRTRSNVWGSEADPRFQLRIDAIPKALLTRAAQPADWTPPPAPRKQKQGASWDAVVIGDHHAPYQEPTFHRLFLEFLADEQPELIEVNGDLLDFSSISRHREREGTTAGVNECLQAGFNILRDYREVCPDARIRFKRGNHSERLQHLILDNARGLHNVTPADSDIPAMSLRRLLLLDELHVEYIDEEWDQAKTMISPKLTARHGFSTSPSAGKNMLDKLTGSTVQGHDHRAGVTVRTEHTNDPDEPLRIRMALQGACACIIPGGLGYIAGGEPDWVNGYSAFRIWPDGDFHATLGLYVPGRLLATNGKRYVA